MNPGIGAWRPAATLAGVRLGDLFNVLALMATQSGHRRRVPGTATPARRYPAEVSCNCEVECRVMDNVVGLPTERPPARKANDPREIERLGWLLNTATILEPGDLERERSWQLEVERVLKGRPVASIEEQKNDLAADMRELLRIAHAVRHRVVESPGTPRALPGRRDYRLR